VVDLRLRGGGTWAADLGVMQDSGVHDGCNPPSALTKNQQVSATSRFPPEPKIKHLEGSDGSIVRDPPQIKRLGRGRRVAPVHDWGK